MPLPEAYARNTTTAIHCPSGWVYLWRPADFAYLLKRGLVTRELREAAVRADRVVQQTLRKVATGEADPDNPEVAAAMSEANTQAGQLAIDAQLAASIVAMRPDDEEPWQQVLLTADDVDQLDPRDREALRAVVRGDETPRSVDVVVLADQGRMDADEALAIYRQEQEARPGSWAEFRRIARRGGAGRGGGGVGQQAEPDAGPDRAAAGVPAGRGAGDQAAGAAPSSGQEGAAGPEPGAGAAVPGPGGSEATSA